MKIFYILLGGALGTFFRYFLSNIFIIKNNFPFCTLIINFLGSFLIGLIAFYSKKYNINENFFLFVKIGVCGGFTTFSSFSLETFQLLENGKFFYAFSYIVLSISLCLIGIYLSKIIVNV